MNIREAQSFRENLGQWGDHLAESTWKDYCGSISDTWDRRISAILLENQRAYEQQLQETTLIRDPGLATLQQFTFPIIRAIFPNLIARELVSVQPMMSNASEIFYMNFIYGSNKGATTVGQGIVDDPDHLYASDIVSGEVLAADVGTSTTSTDNTSHSNVSYLPVRPHTFELTVTLASSGNPDLVFSDDGQGNLTTSNALDTGTVNYSTGAWTVDTSATGASGALQDNSSITAAYEYENEGVDADSVPQIDMILTSSPIIARTRKLRTRWSLEAAFNLRNLYGIDAEAEMVATLAEELKFEIDQEIIRDLQRIANAGAEVSFDTTVPSGISQSEHYNDFMNTLVAASQNIFASTRRAQANWLVCGTDAANVVEVMDRFVPEAVPAGTLGAQRIGTLAGRWTVYKDPYMEADRFLVGYKGSNFLEAGYVYAPYIPLFMTDKVSLDDFVVRKGVGTKYGKKSINGRFFQNGRIL